MSATVRRTVAPAYWHTHVEKSARRRWYSLVVYDTTAELVAAGNRYRPGEDFTGVGGLVHLTDAEPANGFVGIIRLSRQNLDSEVVAHEATHAALGIWRRERSHRVYLGESIGRAEESFAYLLGDLFASIVYELQQSGVWPTP